MYFLKAHGRPCGDAENDAAAGEVATRRGAAHAVERACKHATERACNLAGAQQSSAALQLMRHTADAAIRG